jgi:serine/threonine protein kinase
MALSNFRSHYQKTSSVAVMWGGGRIPSSAHAGHTGPYEIVSPIGAGVMGQVFRARDTRMKRQVAVKILPEEFAANAFRRSRAIMQRWLGCRMEE